MNLNVATKQGIYEWRAHWTLAMAALVGFSTIGLQSYGISSFVEPLEAEFGWTRAQVMIGVSVSNALGIFLNIIIGLIVDRFGSRRVALTGLVVKTGSFALLATATGSLLNWSMLWAILAVGVVMVQSTVWTRALARYFNASRGLALAVALCGTPIAAMVLPVLSISLIANFGWRAGIVGVAAAWLLVTFPIVFVFFREDRGAVAHEIDQPGHGGDMPGLSAAQGFRTRAFYCLLISFGCFSFYSMTIATNLVPLLAETGIGRMEVASIASIMGIVGIIARLSVGFLLDRFPGNIIGTSTMLLPVLGAAILLMDPGPLLVAVAVATFGAAIGAEMDVALYLATRHFGLKAFGTLFSAIITFGALMASLGPFIGGRFHDMTGNYDALLFTVILLMSIGAMAIAMIGRPPAAWT